MGSLQTPPGHPAHSLALITAKFGDLKIAVAPPDADLKVRICALRVPRYTTWPCTRHGDTHTLTHSFGHHHRIPRYHHPSLTPAHALTQEPHFVTEDGNKITSSSGISKHLVETGGQTDALYPPATATEIDDLLDLAATIERHAAAWLEPTCQAATDADREGARAVLTPLLHTLDSRIEGSDFVVGNGVTIADIALAASLLGLYQDVVGQDVQSSTPHIVRWLQGLLAHPNFHAILGTYMRIYLFYRLTAAILREPIQYNTIQYALLIPSAAFSFFG